jgi:Amt family ammonium transporter
VAERIKFAAYIIVAIIVTAIIYPIFGHWAWSEQGWLKDLGFVDFAGSSVVHSMGGWIGLAGAIVLGPRLGKFKHGVIKHFAQSNHNFIVFGVFILIFAWFGFNGGSLLKFDLHVTSILLNTLISAMFGGLGGWVISVFFNKMVEIEVFAFGIISGLVGITAGCASMDMRTSAFVGFSSAFVMALSDYIILRKLKIDDPVTAVSVHGSVGAWGTLCVGLFATIPENLTRIDFIQVQLLGIIVVFAFAFSSGLILFYFLHRISLLRVSKKYEVIGLNVSEHNARLPWVDTVESITKIMNTGNFSKKIYEERDTEIGMVAKFFNYLLVVLQEKQIDLTERNQILKSKAEIDPLTKLFNRRTALETLQLKTDLNKLGLIVIDIDHFKLVNDTYGHNAGDTVLKELAQILSSTTRKNDMAIRWGGEEFVLIIHNTSLNELENIAEKLRIKIEKHSFSKVKNITVSLGVSVNESIEQSFDELFECADKALYQAKKLGRNRVSTH